MKNMGLSIYDLISGHLNVRYFNYLIFCCVFGPDVLEDDVFARVDLLAVPVAALDANPLLVYLVEPKEALKNRSVQ